MSRKQCITKMTGRMLSEKLYKTIRVGHIITKVGKDTKGVNRNSHNRQIVFNVLHPHHVCKVIVVIFT